MIDRIFSYWPFTNNNQYFGFPYRPMILNVYLKFILADTDKDLNHFFLNQTIDSSATGFKACSFENQFLLVSSMQIMDDRCADSNMGESLETFFCRGGSFNSKFRHESEKGVKYTLHK